MHPCASDDMKYYLNEWKQPNKQELKKREKRQKTRKEEIWLMCYIQMNFLRLFKHIKFS